MTDMESLFSFRMQEADETLSEALKMLNDSSFSARSVVNRAYYAMFYATMALFIKTGHKTETSKHSGIISKFDQIFIKSGLLDKDLSKKLHRAFDNRQESDYREMVITRRETAATIVEDARYFTEAIKRFLENAENLQEQGPQQSM